LERERVGERERGREYESVKLEREGKRGERWRKGEGERNVISCLCITKRNDRHVDVRH